MEILFIIIFAGLVLLLDRDIDPYPPPLPLSDHPRREITVVLCLWGMALGMNALRVQLIDPRKQGAALHPALGELIYLPFITLAFYVLPLYLNRKLERRPLAELGLTSHNHSLGVTIFALAFGAISGTVAFWSGATVVGVQASSLGALLLLVYNNAFLEEFFYRGVIQTRLERVVGPRRALMVTGVLFAATHLALDYSVLISVGGLAAVLYALLMQTLGGWLLGLIFVKTRTLWPGVVCHYLVNWLPSLLAGFSIP